MSTQLGYRRLINLLNFARVVEAGSFAEAARRAGSTTSAMSKAVSRFERQNRVRLLHRTTHAISLTAEGERLLEGTQDLLRDAERVEAMLDQTAFNGARGRIRLSAPAPLIRAQLARQMPAILRANPEMNLDLKVDDSAPGLAAEGIDVAVRFGAMDGQPGLIGTPLGSFPWVLCCTPHYIQVMGEPASPTALDRHHQIGFRDPATGQLVPWQFRDPETGESHRIVPRSRLIVEDMSAAWHMMRQGLGLVWLPAWVGLDDLRHMRVIEILRAWRIPETPVRAIRLDRRFTPLRVQILLDCLVEASRGWRET